jgi:hypothetical protein
VTPDGPTWLAWFGLAWLVVFCVTGGVSEVLVGSNGLSKRVVVVPTMFGSPKDNCTRMPLVRSSATYSFIIYCRAKKLLLTASREIMGGCPAMVVETMMVSLLTTSVALDIGVEKVGVLGAEVC